MKKLVLVASACAVLFLSAAASAAGPVGPAGKGLTLQFVDVTVSFSSTFSQNRPPKIGDTFAFRDNIYRWNGTKRGNLVGHANIAAVVLTQNLARLSAVAYLPGGSFVIFGDNYFNRRNQAFAIVGGTGTFANARGEILVRNLGGEQSNTSAITVKLTL